MANLPQPQLKKEGTIVKVFANDIMILKKIFRSKRGRCEWMGNVVEALKGVNNAYFEISFYYTQRNVPQYEYVKRQRERMKQELLVLKDKVKEPLLDEPPKHKEIKFVTPKSFKHPPGIYSNTQWNEL